MKRKEEKLYGLNWETVIAIIDRVSDKSKYLTAKEPCHRRKSWK